MSESDKIVRLVDKETSCEKTVPAFLRALATRIENGEFKNVDSAAEVTHAVVVLNVELSDNRFYLKLRRTHNVSNMEALGMLQTIAHDALHRP